MNIKKIIFLIITVVFIISIIFFIKSNYKKSKTGNNISNKSADEIEKYILNIESYNTIAQVTVKSNKNENKYKLRQQYIKNENLYKQETIEPENIAGTQFIYNEGKLKIENTKLNLNKIYENYQYIESNILSLNSFIEDYTKSDKSKCYEENENIILEVDLKNNKYTVNKKLYVNKKEGKIEKMEIKDETQNTRIYILYSEMEINTTSKEEVIAFSMKTIEENI